MFSDATLNAIRERMNLVDLVGEYVQLKKSGQAYQGLCPFHSEKSPSFYVHPLKQVFRCFGCQKGGNVFTFLMNMDGLSFPEAVEKLADRTGVRLEKVQRGEKTRNPLEGSERLLEALQWAARYFHYLFTEVNDYQFAVDYLQKRGIERETIEKFQIGVSPKGWNTLLRQLLKRGFTLGELIKAGLVVERAGSESGGYDRFRERLMFPIRNREGLIVGFGARALKSGDEPKYLNSPESPLFSKRRLMYGLYESQRGIRQESEAILVEGYMDVVGLHQSGISNAIATMGTALTEEHCLELKSLTRNAVTVFDPDRAGMDAWHRSVHLFLSTGFFAKDLSLPEGLDPDEFIRKEGAESFRKLCAAAPRQVTKLLKEIAKKGPLSETAVSQTLSELTPLLVASRRLPDRAVLWDDISLVLGVSLPVLRDIADSASKRAADPKQPPSSHKRDHRTAPPGKSVFHPLDLRFFSACVLCPENFLQSPQNQWEGGLEEGLIKTWLGRLTQAANVRQFQDLLTDLLTEHKEAPAELLSAASAGVFEEPSRKETQAEFPALLASLSKKQREKEIKALSAQVKLTARLGDAEEQIKLLSRLRELRSD